MKNARCAATLAISCLALGGAFAFAATATPEESAQQILAAGRAEMNQTAAADKAGRTPAAKAAAESSEAEALCVAGIFSSKRDLGDFPHGGYPDGIKAFCSGLTKPQATCVAGIFTSRRDLGDFPGGYPDGITKYCAGLTQPQATCVAGIFTSERDLGDFPDGGYPDGIKKYCAF